MPKQSYNEQMTQTHVLRLFTAGRYTVDLKTGIVTGRTGMQLMTYSDKSGYQWLRLFDQPYIIALAIHRLVWIIGSEQEIPDGFVIHHIDGNIENNSFENLICVSHPDHYKLHNQIEEEIPF